MSVREAAAANLRVGLVVQGALAIAMVAVFLLLFRGVTNILNAFFVPLVIFAFTRGTRLEEALSVHGALLVFVALFFKLQLVFMLLYCAIGFLLDALLQQPQDEYQSRRTLLVTLTLSLAISLGLWTAVVLTDDLFGTRIQELTLLILQGNTFAYALVLWIESFLVTAGLLYFAEKLAKVL